MTNAELIQQLEEEFEDLRLSGGSIEKQTEILKQIRLLMIEIPNK